MDEKIIHNREDWLEGRVKVLEFKHRTTISPEVAKKLKEKVREQSFADTSQLGFTLLITRLDRLRDIIDSFTVED